MVSKIIKQFSKLPNKGIQNNTAIKFNFNVGDIMESHFLNQLVIYPPTEGIIRIYPLCTCIKPTEICKMYLSLNLNLGLFYLIFLEILIYDDNNKI